VLIFKKTIEVRWSDIDANCHVTHTAYASFGTDTRVEWMNSLGWSVTRLFELGFNGVLLKEETEYHREIVLGEKVVVELLLAGYSIDHARWKFVHNIYKSNHKLAAKHTVYGAWINAATRKIKPPPRALAHQLEKLPKMSGFEILKAL